MKVLYVCPLAQEQGHMPWAAAHEPQFLGNDVTLLTYRGVAPACPPQVPQLKVINSVTWEKRTNSMRKYFFLRWVARLMDEWATLWKAARIGKNYDYIFLRDAEPFTFMPALVSLIFRGRKWVISLTGGNFTTIRHTMKYGRHPIAPLIYLAIVHGPWWKVVYWLAPHFSKFQYITQDSQTLDHYATIFPKRLNLVPLGVEPCESWPQDKARQALGIPQDKLVLLIFGVTHTGKRSEMVFRAVASNPNTFLIHAGASYESLGVKPSDYVERYQLQKRTVIKDYFIPESEKAIYFGAADYVVLSYAKSFSSTSSVLWQACAYNRPVVSSDANILGQLVKTYQLGVLFQAEDLHSLEEALQQASDLKERFNGNCKRFLQDFTMEAWGRKVNDIARHMEDN